MSVFYLPYVTIAIQWPTKTELAVLGIWLFIAAVLGTSVYLAVRRPSRA